jgi:hypothetical protein
MFSLRLISKSAGSKGRKQRRFRMSTYGMLRMRLLPDAFRRILTLPA